MAIGRNPSYMSVAISLGSKYGEMKNSPCECCTYLCKYLGRYSCGCFCTIAVDDSVLGSELSWSCFDVSVVVSVEVLASLRSSSKSCFLESFSFAEQLFASCEVLFLIFLDLGPDVAASLLLIEDPLEDDELKESLLLIEDDLLDILPLLILLLVVREEEDESVDG